MKRIFLALLLTCVGAAGSVTLSGQKGLPSCDADNGGLTLPAGFCALVVHDGGIGEGRHIVVNDNGDIYVILRRGPRPAPTEPFGPGASWVCETPTEMARPMSSVRNSGPLAGLASNY